MMTTTAPSATTTGKRAQARWRPRALDVAVTALALTMTVADLKGDVGFIALLLAVGASVPLVVVRRAPLAVFVVMVAANVGLNAAGVFDGFGSGPTFALYVVALRQDVGTAASLGTVALVFGSMVVLTVTDRWDNEFVDPVTTWLVWLGVWYVGHWVGQRRAAGAEHERRVEQDQRLAVAQERTRIARDLHDSAGHAINVILVQAGGARLQLDRDADAVRTALETIESVARETLVEIDRLVTALRDAAADGDDLSDAIPGLAALDRLVDRSRAAGLDVTVDVQGERSALPFGVDRAAYRIVQEALTNAARHGAGEAHVTVVYTADAVDLTVANPVPGAGNRPASPAHGITGMRERAALLGGHLTTRLESGRFRLAAHLPVDPDLA